jgi:hypothetical protein
LTSWVRIYIQNADPDPSGHRMRIPVWILDTAADLPGKNKYF